MASKPVIFISAVSKELRSTRDLVAKVLLSLGYDPVWQDLFGLEDGTVKEMLRRKIDASDGLIQLVGHSYGAESQTPDADFGRVSYTQYEALYARQQKKRVWYLVLEESFPADAHEPESEEQRQMQLAYRQRLQSEDHLFHNLVSGTDIELRLMKLRDELSHLRRKGKQWAALVLALLVVLVLGIVWLKRGQANTDAGIAKTEQKMDSVLQRYKQMEQALIKLADAETSAKQFGEKLTPEQLRQRAYTLLENELGIPAGLLSKELPGFALELYSRPDTTLLMRARAAYALNKFDEAEKLFLESEAQDKKAFENAQQTTEKLRAQRIEALVGAGQSATAQIHYLQAMEHYRAAAALTSQERDIIEWLKVQNAISWLLHLQGHYPELLSHTRQLWQFVQEAGKDEVPAVITAHMYYALALWSLGQASAAEPEYRAVIKAQERVLGVEYRYTLASRNNLTVALYAQAKYAEAEQELRAILKITERVLGAEHSQTLSSRNNLAEVLRFQCKNVEAEQEHRAVLAIRERVFGKDHPDTLVSRNNLAAVLCEEGKYAEAEQEDRIVLAIRERLLGNEHPDTLISRMSVANAFYIQIKYAEAEQEYRAVLVIQERVLGMQHPDVAFSCYNLALCLAAQHKFPEALAFMQRAEQVRTKMLGPEHPNTKLAKAERERIEAAMKAR